MRGWLVRAGRYGEREGLALKEHLVAIGWDDLPDAADVRRELLAVYDRLPGDIRAKLPLKQIWVLAADGEEG